jgi:universal stress protein A
MIEFQRILCPLDVGHDSLSALDVARGTAERYGSTIYLLHVARVPAASMDAPMPIGPHPHWEQAAQKWLTDLALKHLQGKVPWQVVVRVGIPDGVILDVVRDLQIDLVVMATHGRTGLAHFILGSVTENVVREAPCPVMVVKP